ncbi:MAG TPA: BatD family protein [Salinibacter sp.]|nr:BatD family protein [Salinibacter sp.]
MRTRLLVVLTGLGLLLGSRVCAQPSDVTVSATAQPSEVGTEERVTFTIEVTGAPRSTIQTPEPPPTANLVLQDPTPSPRRELSFDSGSLTRRITYKWTYRPMQVGIGRIRSANIRIRGKTYTTDEIRIRIVPQSQRPGRPPRPHGASPAPSSRSSSRSSSALGPRDLFIQATASTDAAYQNEQVMAEYRLFFRPGVRLRQSRMADAWDAPGFWREELDVASRPTPRTAQLYGDTYKSIVLKRVALFPTRAGTLNVDPLRIETEAQTRPQMGQTPRPPYEPVTLSSKALSVVARSLPPNAPAAFDGAVGQFSLRTTVDTNSVQVGDAITLTARLQGTGNLATVSPPAVDPPSDFEVYEPSVRADIDRSGDTVHGTKTFTYTLVPRSNGRFTLPPVRFAYFDPDTEQYETIRSEPTALQVTGDVPPDAVAQTGQGLPVGKIAGPIEGDGHWVRPDRPPLHRQPWAYGALLVPIALAAGGLAYRRYAGTGAAVMEAPPEGLDAAQQHLQAAHRDLREGNVRAFYQTIERAVFTFFTTRLGLSRTPAGLTREALARHLARHDVPDAEQNALHDLLDACDEAQFTPAEPSHETMQAALDQAQTLLLRLDEMLPVRRASKSA